MNKFDQALQEAILMYQGVRLFPSDTYEHTRFNIAHLEAEQQLLRDRIKHAVERYVIGDGELHYSHVCPGDNIDCAKFAARSEVRNHQRAVVRGETEK